MLNKRVNRSREPLNTHSTHNRRHVDVAHHTCQQNARNIHRTEHAGVAGLPGAQSITCGALRINHHREKSQKKKSCTPPSAWKVGNIFITRTCDCKKTPCCGYCSSFLNYFRQKRAIEANKKGRVQLTAFTQNTQQATCTVLHATL